jgi:hypothetical protein
VKTIAAILLTGILLFTWGGYRPLLHYLQQANETAITNAIADEQFSAELVSIKVATQLPPYAADSRSFEWIKGEVEVAGHYYQYVKRRIFKDSIEYLCIADQGRKQIENARENFFRLCNDLSTSKKTDSPQTVVKPFSFETTVASAYANHPVVTSLQTRFRFVNESFSSSIYHTTPEQPPEAFIA